jgi:hypothetical protein
MAYIRVIYKKENYGFDYVSSRRLDTLIMGDEITHFYRPAEKRWISIKFDPVRGNGGLYEGTERRQIIDRPNEEVQKIGKDERKRSPNWLKDLWLEIGRS